MNEGLNQLTELVPSLYREARRHGILLAAMFATIALAALVIGSFWPKTYAASTTILAQATDIIQPLMEGRAVPTSNTDRAGIARQVVFGHKVMGEIVKTGGWDSEPPMVQDRIIELLNEREKPMAFILWGSPARRKKAMITNPHHYIVESPHPSPLSASRGFFGSRPFSRVNDFLKRTGQEPIDWQLPDI